MLAVTLGIPLGTLQAARAEAGSDTLRAGETLAAGTELRSGRGQYRLVMQGDGNLVMYSQSVTDAVWASGTDGHPGARAVMQGDGNLVVRDKANRALWASGTDGRDGASLRIQDDRNLVVYRNGRAVWASGTQVRPSGGGVIGDDYPEPWRSGRLDQYVDTWGNYFAGRGVAVNGTPAVGAIAETSGHVAWVAQVHGDGTVTVEEYNTPAGSGRYAVRRVPRSSFRYIHVKDMS